MKKILHSAMSGFPTSCKANFSLGREKIFPREAKIHLTRGIFSDLLMPVVDVVSNLYK